MALLDLPWIKAGPVARFISERTLSGGFGSIGSNGNFFGLHNVGFTAELGGFLELWPTDFIRARLEARGGSAAPTASTVTSNWISSRDMVPGHFRLARASDSGIISS